MDQLKKKLVVVLAFTFLFAGEVKANPAGSGKDAPAIIADVFICRPLGLMALTGGSALYVLTLPFTVPAKGKEAAKRTLVPVSYTHLTLPTR